MYDNRYWEGAKQVPQDEATRKQLEGEAQSEDTTSRHDNQLRLPSREVAGGNGLRANGDASDGHVWVALKRIYVTSSPDRIQNELDIMEDLR